MDLKSIVALLVVSALPALPVFAGQHQQHFVGHGGDNEGIELGGFFSGCCGSGSASASTLHLPGKGFAVELQVADPSCCDSPAPRAGTRIENLDTNVVKLFKGITFTLTGPGTASADASNFNVFVVWTDPHTNTVNKDSFTLANGGLTRHGSQFALNVNNHFDPITPGSRLGDVEFELDGNCVAATQILDLQNVFIDKTLVNYELDHGVIEDEGSFCSGQPG